MTLVGAAITPKTGQTWAAAITEFETLTGRKLPVRRCYDNPVYADLAKSNARYDLGQRKSILSIKPTTTTPVETIEALAASITTAGHDCDVIVYHEPIDNMTGDQFIALYQRTAPPLRAAGIPVGVCYTNWSCNLPYDNTQSALAHYWPGDRIVDFLAIDEYPLELASGKDATPMDVRTQRVTQFADARGIPIGLAEYGVDPAWDAAKSERWLRSVTDWATARASTGKPLRWACYFHSTEGGNYPLTRPEHITAYSDACQILDGRP